MAPRILSASMAYLVLIILSSALHGAVASCYWQTVCDNSLCNNGCQQSEFQQSRCYQTQQGSIASVCTDDNNKLTQQVFIFSSDCSGFSQVQTVPCGACLSSGNAYVDYSCGSGTAPNRTVAAKRTTAPIVTETSFLHVDMHPTTLKRVSAARALRNATGISLFWRVNASAQPSVQLLRRAAKVETTVPGDHKVVKAFRVGVAQVAPHLYEIRIPTTGAIACPTHFGRIPVKQPLGGRTSLRVTLPIALNPDDEPLNAQFVVDPCGSM